ncbi:MAG: sigma-70 family RNA polymerase sigma factor [Bacteroidota bacterium]
MYRFQEMLFGDYQQANSREGMNGKVVVFGDGKRNEFRVLLHPDHTHMTHAVAISEYTPLLEQIAYRILKCKADAQDVVQETLLKWMKSNQQLIEDTRAYLIRSVINNCLKHLEQARVRMTRTLDNLPVGKMSHYFTEMNFSHLDFDQYLEGAMRTLHLKLEPLERAVFLLREAFDLDYESVARELNRKADHCRKLFSRARVKLSSPGFQLPAELPDVSGFLEIFRNSSFSGDPAGLIERLRGEIDHNRD